MGYESRIYIIQKTNTIGDNGKRYARQIAMFEMGKIYGVSNCLRDFPKTDSYIYADDRDTEILTDYYGAELTECLPEELIKLIKKDIKKNGEYLRYNLLLATLRELNKLNDPMIFCLHFGY